MKKEEQRFADSLIFEGMTSIRAVIQSMENKSGSRRIIKIYYSEEKASSKAKEIAYLKRCGDKFGFDVIKVSAETIDSLTVGSTHGGIIAECSDRTLPSLANGTLNPEGFYVMIEGIEDPYNFGYAIRSIYAAGADGIILSKRNWMSAAGVVARASAGTSELIDVYVEDPLPATEFFKYHGYRIVSAGIRDSVSAYDADLKKPILLIVGGEKRGISRAILDLSDTIVRLDYGREFNGSLSAASAASILAYEVFRQNR